MRRQFKIRIIPNKMLKVRMPVRPAHPGFTCTSAQGVDKVVPVAMTCWDGAMRRAIHPTIRTNHGP